MTHHQNSSLVNIAREKVVSARLRSDKAESCIDAVMQEKQALALKLSEIQEKVVRLECELQQRQEETLLLRARVGTLESLLPAACALADGAQAISMVSARHASGLSVSPLHEHADIWPQESLKKLPSARSSWPMGAPDTLANQGPAAGGPTCHRFHPWLWSMHTHTQTSTTFSSLYRGALRAPVWCDQPLC